MEDKVKEPIMRGASSYNEWSLTYRCVVSFTILTFCTFSIQDDKNGDARESISMEAKLRCIVKVLLGHVLKVKPTCKKGGELSYDILRQPYFIC